MNISLEGYGMLNCTTLPAIIPEPYLNEKDTALWKPFVEFTITENMKTCNTTLLFWLESVHGLSENKQAKDAVK